MANAYNMRPDLLTIQLGEQNDTIVNLIKDCFDKVKDHDFTGANVCAAQILANQGLFDTPLMFVALASLAIIGLVFYGLVVLAERRLVVR